MQSHRGALHFGDGWRLGATGLSVRCRVFQRYHCRRRRACHGLGLGSRVSMGQHCHEPVESGGERGYQGRSDGERASGRCVGRIDGARGKGDLERDSYADNCSWLQGHCCGRQMSSDLLSGRSIFALVCSEHSMLLRERGPVSEQLYTMSLPLAVSSLDVVHFLMATILNPLSPTRRPLLSWPTSQQPGRVPHPQVAFCSSVCLGHLASLPSERLCLFDCLRHVYLTQHLHSLRLVDKSPRCP